MRRMWGTGKTAGLTLARTAQKHNAGHLMHKLHNRALSTAVSAARRRCQLLESADVMKDGSVRFMFRDGASGQYHPMWLRLNCATNSWQANPAWNRLTPTNLDDQQIMATKVTPVDKESSNGHESVEIIWGDGHKSIYCSEWLREHDYSIPTVIEKTQSTWPRPIHEWESIPRTSFSDLQKTDEEVFCLLKKVNMSGLCLIDEVGTEEGAAKAIAERIAPISHSSVHGELHGLSTHGIDVPDLHLHQDLLYYESPPGLQLLHCTHLDDSIEGGESIFLDGFAAATELRNRSPEDFAVLTSTPATFQSLCPIRFPSGAAGCYHMSTCHENSPYNTSLDTSARDSQNSHCFVYQRPHITVNTEGEITGVFWSPRYEGVLGIPHEHMSAYYRAYSAFSNLIYNSDWAKEHTVSRRLLQGECYVFNNRRILHCRRGYRGSGKRCVQGCHTNVDEGLSKLVVMQGKFEDDSTTIKRWGNNSIPLQLEISRKLML